MGIKRLIKRFFEKQDEKEARLIREKLKNTYVNYRVYKEDKKKLEDKIVIITGGSGAIGSAIAFKLATEGAISILIGRNKDKLEQVKKQIDSNNGKAEIYVMDVSNYEDIKRTIKNIYDKYKKIDILINCAGGSERNNSSLIKNQKIEVIDEMINVNLRGPVLCSKESLQYMKKGAKIINIGSTVGIGGLKKFSMYCASKAGIIGFTKSLAMECAEEGISVNAVTPGVTNQFLFDKYLEEEKTSKNWIGRKITEEEIANAVEFLCRDENSSIIGQNIVIDGGRSLGLHGE